MKHRTVSIVRNTTRGRKQLWQVRFRDSDNKRRSKFFATKAIAEVYADARRIELRNFGARALSLPDSVREDAQRGLELLAPYGKSISDAVKFYLAHLERSQRSVPIDKLVSEFLWEKEGQNLSQPHLCDLKNRLARFTQAFAGRMVNTLEADELGAWIKGLALGQQSKLHYRRVLNSFFAYAVRQKCADTNPIADTPKIKVPESEVVIYTPQELAALLAHADLLLVPYLTLGAFSGIRRAELLRLSWQDIRFTHGHIFIGSHIAKTQSKRLIPIAENLREWILPLGKNEGLVAPDSGKVRKLIQQACAKANVKWKQNALRHSFASYRLADVSDVNKVAIEMGNNRMYLDEISNAWVGTKTDKQLKLQVGPLLSGSSVVAAITLVERLKRQSRKIVGLDMETYGVYFAADNAMPTPLFLSMKSVCDFADKKKSNKFQQYAAYTSASYLKQFLINHFDPAWVK